jgi:hypothetical protein
VQIKIETTVLADADLAVGRVGPFGLTLNGTQIVDEALFFRAASPTYFVRGGAGVALTFSVTRFFSSVRAAEAFALLHFGEIPREGLVTVTAGEEGDTQVLYLRDAALDGFIVPGTRGTCVVVQYTLRGGLWESDIPSEEIPGDPDNGEEFVVMRRGKVSIAADATAVSVTFSSPLSASPVVTPHISRPAGSPRIDCSLDEDSVSNSGFTVQLSAPTPDASYKLHYTAVE